MPRIFASPLLATLLLFNLLSLLVLIIPYVSPLPTEAVQVGSGFESSSNKDIEQSSSRDYSSALDRPLFHVNRRKPVEEIVAVKQVVKQRIEAPFSLVGIVGGADNGRSAYLQHKETGETIVVQQGEAAGVWQVDTVGQDFVTLILDNERRVIQLVNGG